MKLSCSGLVITKKVTVFESEVSHSRYGNKCTGAPKLKKSAGIGEMTTFGYCKISLGILSYFCIKTTCFKKETSRYFLVQRNQRITVNL